MLWGPSRRSRPRLAPLTGPIRTQTGLPYTPCSSGDDTDGNKAVDALPSLSAPSIRAKLAAQARLLCRLHVQAVFGAARRCTPDVHLSSIWSAPPFTFASLRLRAAARTSHRGRAARALGHVHCRNGLGRLGGGGRGGARRRAWLGLGVRLGFRVGG